MVFRISTYEYFLTIILLINCQQNEILYYL